MPAELLLLLIVAAFSPSRQVLSSLRMGEALEAPLHPASPGQTSSHWAPLLPTMPVPQEPPGSGP